MADRSVVEIDVESESFQKFAAQFERYQKMLDQTLATWKQINQQMGSAPTPGGKGSSGGSGGGMLGGMFNTTLLERNRNEVGKIMTHFHDLERMAKPGGALYGLIGLMPGGAPGLQLLSKMAAGGPIAAGLTLLAAGFGGAIMAAPGAADERRRTLGMGVGVTEARAFNAAMGRNILGDPNAALQALGSAQFDVGSRERMAMNMLFGAQGARAELGKDRTTAMFDILEKMRTRLEGYRPELRATMAQSMGMTNLVPMGDINAWMGLSPQQRADQRNAAMQTAKDAKDQADQVRGATDALAKLNTALQRMETAVSNVSTVITSKFAEPLTKAVDEVTAALNRFLKFGLGSIHTGPMTPEDIQRNKDMGYDPFGAKLDPGGKTSPNFPNGLDKPAVPWWRQKNFGFGFRSGSDPATPGNAAWTPGPSSLMGGDSGLSEWMKKWFMEESAATKSAADAAQKRDQQITNLLDYLIGHKSGTAAAAGAVAGANAVLGGGAAGGGGGLTFSNATGSIMPKGGGGFSATSNVFGGSGSTVARGNLAKNQSEAYAAAKAAGLSDTAARALVANFSGESLSDPGNTTGDRGQAQGIGQWHPDRARAIAAHFGKLPSQMSVTEQTQAAIWEMKTNPAYKQSWAALTGGGSSENILSTLVSNYERPGDTATATAQRLRFLHGLKVGGAAAPDTKAGDVIGSPTGVRARGGALTDEQKAFFKARGATDEQLAGVRPEFADREMKLLQAAEGATGQKVHMESMYRSIEKQRDIYEHPGKYGAPMAAKPGYSPHNFGIAADISRNPAVVDYINRNASKFGLEAVPGDPGHTQMSGARSIMSKLRSGGDGPMAMNNWQAPDRKSRFTVNSNFGADISVQAATLVS